MTEFSDGAHWLGMPAEKMSKEDWMHACWYKLRELRYCYMIMTPQQSLAVAKKMEDVPIPIMRGEPS